MPVLKISVSPKILASPKTSASAKTTRKAKEPHYRLLDHQVGYFIKMYPDIKEREIEAIKNLKYDPKYTSQFYLTKAEIKEATQGMTKQQKEKMLLLDQAQAKLDDYMKYGDPIQ